MTNEGGTAGYSPSLELRNSVVQETGFLYFVPDTLELRISRHCVVALPGGTLAYAPLYAARTVLRCAWQLTTSLQFRQTIICR